MKNIQRRILASIIVIVTIVTLGMLARHYTSVDWLIAQEAQVREYVRANPVRSFLMGFMVYTCLSLIPGTSGKSVVFGWLYGFWTALVLVDMALTVAALLTFLVSRYLFREAVEERFHVQLGYFRKKLESNAGFYLLTIRLLHAPFSFVNYGSGATNIVPVSTFWWTTQLGLVPGTMVFVFAGTRIPTLSVIAEHGVVALLDSTLIAALITTSALPVVIRGISALIRRGFSRRHDDCDENSDAECSGDSQKSGA